MRTLEMRDVLRLYTVPAWRLVRVGPLQAQPALPRPCLRTRRVSRAHPKGAAGRTVPASLREGSRPRGQGPGGFPGASPKGANGVLGRDDVLSACTVPHTVPAQYLRSGQVCPSGRHTWAGVSCQKSPVPVKLLSRKTHAEGKR
jgi:hypothetical protein